MKNITLYPHSFSEAKRNDEVQTYYDSHKANVSCKMAIDETINLNYTGTNLEKGSAKQIIDVYGFDRTAYVLANSIQQRSHDVRITNDNKQWAKSFFVPPDIVQGIDQRLEFQVSADTGLLNIFTNQYKQEFEQLNLWNTSQVHDPRELNFEKKIMILKPTILNEEHKTRDEQLFFASGGFGCTPHKSGKVMGEFLVDGEKCHFYRHDFIGEAKQEHLPKWAKEKLAQKLEQKLKPKKKLQEER